MQVHVLQHVPFEGLGSIEKWLQERNASISYTRFFETPGFPSLDQVDLLIILGGPMSVNDEHRLPWLQAEKRYIADAVKSNKAVLGICLGAQLIASSLGANVYPAQEKELGWFPIFGQESPSGTFPFPPSTKVFHWHGETFDLPAQAMLLASSEGCQNQAFQIGARTLGLQFHLETTPESAHALSTLYSEELVAQRPYIQSGNTLHATPVDTYAKANALMAKVLEYLTATLD
ncbi:type 1 glutamine amidotransferase [Azomonas macrocytogenes]|uniref:GMP synthase-like glutamine amidotransferase n=1 Tax=Azomonas macrocytogenes TaxID=69962 RepID=A0A839T5E7_AZOMA|nr:type 1 glutamine amidotransferase [Azomonas macrocytogenes]MBB3104741.1 GMP synthase-like glutamine amidotransferase [Azomonas macrocytogenes]